MGSDETPEQLVHRITGILDDAGVQYMLTGSMASGFHGAPRASHDVDIVVAPNLGALLKLLTFLPVEHYYWSKEAALEAYGSEGLFNVIDLATGWKIDFIIKKSRAFSTQEFERRAETVLEGRAVFIASAEDVLLAKLEWSKLSGSERQLEDAAGIVRIQGADLDRHYVEKWASSLDVCAQWERVQTGSLAQE